MARAGALRVVNVNIIVTRRNTVFKMYAILEIRDRQRVHTVDHTAFAHADLRGGGQQRAVFKPLAVFFEERVKLEHLAAGFALGKA